MREGREDSHENLFSRQIEGHMDTPFSHHLWGQQGHLTPLCGSSHF